MKTSKLEEDIRDCIIGNSDASDCVPARSIGPLSKRICEIVDEEINRLMEIEAGDDNARHNLMMKKMEREKEKSFMQGFEVGVDRGYEEGYKERQEDEEEETREKEFNTFVITLAEKIKLSSKDNERLEKRV